MGKTKIDWCDSVWNPVWGCKTGCKYCYARKFAKRFGANIAYKEAKYTEKYSHLRHSEELFLKYQLKYFEPTWLESNFVQKFPKKPTRIFVGSMSDIWWWKREWMERVLEKIKQYPQHQFLFLTKFPQVYYRYEFPENCWLGATAVTDEEVLGSQILLQRTRSHNPENIRFLSIEPIQEKITQKANYSGLDWVIVGRETGNRKERIVPPKEWITDIISSCKIRKIPVFLKENITNLYTELKIYTEFPGEEKGI